MVKSQARITAATCLAKDVANSRANEANCSKMAQLAAEIAARHGMAVKELSYDEMLAAGVDVGMIDRFAQNLPPRVKMAERGAFAWGIIAFKKPELGHEGDARGCTLS